ncbi:FixH family protein [Qipengyuania sp.]|uniref:FixH family protein n=1 Tax=Qipengyuania sp. TaxID=2004515 RepID=UPI003736A795
MRREFTGRHMTAVMVAGFGIVIAVNLLMAALATSGFGGVVVDNSYVASQKYNGWLETARRQQQLGWDAVATREGGGRIALATTGVPETATITAELRRPLGRPETTRLAFDAAAPGRYVSRQPVAPGRWIARVTITDGTRRWADEMPLE